MDDEADRKIVKRANDDIDSDSLDDIGVTNNNNDNSKSEEKEDVVGDPWEEMKQEDEAKEQQEREQKRKDRQNELLGIDTDQMNWNDESGLVVPIKNLVQFAGKGRVEFIYLIPHFLGNM